MVSPAEQKAFLDALFARGALPFEDVVLLLGRRGKPPPFAALAQALEFLRNERLFRIVHAETGQEVALDEAVFAQADRHALHLLGIELGLNRSTQQFVDIALPVFDSLASCVVFHSTGARRHPVRPVRHQPG